MSGKPSKIPIEDRYWSCVRKSDDREACWEWLHCLTNGYGCFGKKNNVFRENRAHRISWILSNGPIPEDMHVLHKCDNKSCTNPKHLFLGTHLDNMRDKMAKGRHVALCGERHANSRLTSGQIIEIRAEYSSGGETLKGLAERYGVVASWIHQIVRRKFWRHVP